MKKFAKVLVCVLALTMIASFAFAAAPITSDISSAADDGSGNFQIFLFKDGSVTDAFAGVDITKVASFDITLSWGAADWNGGAFILQSDSLGWKELGQWCTGEEGKAFNSVVSGQAVHVDISENPYAAADTYACITVQCYGVDTNVDSVVLYDADGNVLASAGSTDSGSTDAGSTDSGSTDSGSTDVGTTDKTPGTGDATSVAVLAVVAVIALGGVVVSSKKRA